MVPAPPAESTGQIVIGCGPGPSWIDLKPLRENVAVARLHAEDLLCDHDPDHIYAVALVVSELVTNAMAAVGFARPTRVSLGVQHCERWDHVRVRDGVPDAPVPREADLDDETGRGIHIVDAYTSVHWVVARRYHKTVHAVIAHPGITLTAVEIERLMAR